MAKIYFETYGCAFNQSDTELMMGLLEDAGHKIVKSIKNADIIIENTCTVKDPTEAKFMYKLNELKKLKKPIIIAGCLAQVKKHSFPEYSIIGVDQIENIVEVVEATLKGNIIQIIEKNNKSRRHQLPVIRRNKFIEIIPINKGCLGSCTFCQTKFARGKLHSYHEKDIIERIKKVIKEGVKEIWLTSQDTGAYGLDINSNIVKLLKKIIKIKGDFKIRLGMANPNFVYKFRKELAEIYKNEKMFKFLHVPVQSGSDNVLRKMRRYYTLAQFKEIIKYFREKIPDITISTDVIAGFPEESEEDFKKTYDLLKELKIEVVNISKFSLRPGIEARALKQLDTKVIKKISTALSRLFESYALEQKKKYIGKTLNIFFNEKIDGYYAGKTDNYVSVIYKGRKNVLGKTLKMKVKKATTFNIYC